MNFLHIINALFGKKRTSKILTVFYVFFFQAVSFDGPLLVALANKVGSFARS